MTRAELLAGWSTAHDVLELLRRFGKGSVQETRPYPRTDAERSARGRLVERIRAALAGARLRGEPSLLSHELVELHRLAEEALDTQPSLAAACDLLLTAFDEGLGRILWKAFATRRDVHTLVKGDVFPIGTHPELMRLLDVRHLSERPESQRSIYDQRQYVDVLRHEFDITVAIDYSAGPAPLSKFLETRAVAVALPNDSVKEFECDIDPEARTFFGVRVRDLESQARRIHELLRAADKGGIPVVLLPELSTTAALSKGVGPLLSSSEHLSVVVAGSHHEPVPKPAGTYGANRCESFLLGRGRPAVHGKFSPYVMKKWPGARLDAPVVEHIDARTRHITVHWSLGGWSFTTLVCKDFLDPETSHVLDRVRPNLVFVVAFSDETTAFWRGCESLTGRNQSLTFVANFGGARAYAAIAGLPLPRRADEDQAADRSPVRFRARDVRAPALLCLRFPPWGTENGGLEWNVFQVVD